MADYQQQESARPAVPGPATVREAWLDPHAIAPGRATAQWGASIVDYPTPAGGGVELGASAGGARMPHPFVLPVW